MWPDRSVFLLPSYILSPTKFHVTSRALKDLHLAKSYILKSSPKYTCYTTNTVSDVYLFSLVFTQLTYFPQDVSQTHTSLHSTELQLILRYVLLCCVLGKGHLILISSLLRVSFRDPRNVFPQTCG